MTDRLTGFIGLGVMGQPMAINLARAGTPLVVWNRTPERCQPLAALGARVAASAHEVFAAADTVILMLARDEAIDLVLQRGSAAFQAMVRGRTLVHMGTTSPAYSARLGGDVQAAGGAYFECAVSGSRGPAETGQLVGMLAGHAPQFPELRQLLAPVCATIFECGPVPSALQMKLAVNHYLITMVTGLCEAFHFADQQGLNTGLMQAILAAGPMASVVSKAKMAKLVAGDFSVQAAIVDVLKNNQLVAQEARSLGIASPVLDECHALFAQAVAQGHGELDMAGVLKALEARSRLVAAVPADSADGSN